MTTWLTTREAARRPRRAWRSSGMPVRFVGRRVEVEEETLLLWWRTKTMRNAITKWRIRAAQRAASGS
ncbi:hypothetical protein [Pseudoclavibacter helvolus]|uniref:hypothetical protein n=1 Tax=Pseudoclavibacter helvolus TaxID=255205 RepID=UPI0012E8399D|nr:hypothetical protein [Pseudoclavibacter helvolus]